MSEAKKGATPSINDRENQFNDRLKKLMAELQVGIQARAFITPDGRVATTMSLIDMSPEAVAEREAQMRAMQAQNQGIETAE